MQTRYGACVLCLVVATVGFVRARADTCSQAPPRLVTRWAKDVRPDNVWPEYPRPQMTRPAWQNLNGSWHYAITPRGYDAGGRRVSATDPRAVCRRVVSERRARRRSRRISTSGIDARSRRPTGRPAAACCCISARSTGRPIVSVNGKPVGEHRGGYDPFTFDITDALRPGRRSGDRRSRLGSDRQGSAAARQAGAQPAKHLVHRRHRHLADRVARDRAVDVRRRPASRSGCRRRRVARHRGRGRRRRRRAPPRRIDALDGARVVGSATGRVGESIAVSRAERRSSGRPPTPFLYDLRCSLSTGDAVEELLRHAQDCRRAATIAA